MHTKLIVAILLLSAATVTAHEPPEEPILADGTYLHHTNLHEGTLESGGWNNTTLAWGGVPLKEGWFLLWSGTVEGNGTLLANVLHDNETVHEWAWGSGNEDLVIHRLDQTGFYELSLHNPGPEPIAYRLYYDNTCDCTSKSAQGEESPLWFNYDLTRPGRVAWDVYVVPFEWPKGQDLPPIGNVTVEATVATWTGQNDEWPDGFKVVETFDIDLPPKGDEPLWIQDMGFTAKDAGTNYILLTVHHDGDPRWMFQVRPVVELPEARQIPGPGIVTVASILAVAGVAAHRTRTKQ